MLRLATDPQSDGGKLEIAPPEIFTNVCICYVQQQVKSFCPPRKYQLIAALGVRAPSWTQIRKKLLEDNYV